MNPFTPKSDQFQVSPAASPGILHHSMENLACPSLLRLWKITTLPILTTSLIHFSLIRCENILFELGNEKVKLRIQPSLAWRQRLNSTFTPGDQGSVFAWFTSMNSFRGSPCVRRGFRCAGLCLLLEHVFSVSAVIEPSGSVSYRTLPLDARGVRHAHTNEILRYKYSSIGVPNGATLAINSSFLPFVWCGWKLHQCRRFGDLWKSWDSAMLWNRRERDYCYLSAPLRT